MAVDLDAARTPSHPIMSFPEGDIGTTGGKEHGDGQPTGTCPDDTDFWNGTGGVWHELGLRR